MWKALISSLRLPRNLKRNFEEDSDDDDAFMKIREDSDDEDEDEDKHRMCRPDRHCYKMECTVNDIATADDVDKFLKNLSRKVDSPDSCTAGRRSWTFDTQFLEPFIYSHSVKCITQVLHHIDFNCPCDISGLPPLHLAIRWSCLPLTELFLKHKAPTDFRCQCSDMGHHEMLPLNYSLYILSQYLINLGILTPEQSVYKMLIILCLPELRSKLEIVRLLALETNELGEEIYYYAKYGRLVELAILLLVAREKVTSVSLVKKSPLSQTENDFSGLDHGITLRDFVISELAQLYALEMKLPVFNAIDELTSRCKEKQNLMRSTLLLLEIFRKAGKTLESCLYEQMTQEEVVEEVSRALKEEGFCLDYKDTDIGHIQRFPWPKYCPWGHHRMHRKNAERSYQLGSALTFGVYANMRKSSIFQRPRFNGMQYKRTESPLDEDLESLCGHPLLRGWISRSPADPLLSTLSMMDRENQMETIRSRLDKTEHLGELICCHVKDGNLVKVAALLMLGWKKLKALDSSDSKSGSGFGIRKIRQFIMSEIEELIADEIEQLGNNDAGKLSSMPMDKDSILPIRKSIYKNCLSALYLLEAFERAGDNLDQFIGSIGLCDMTEEDAKDVECLLLNPKGITLTLDCLSKVDGQGPSDGHDVYERAILLTPIRVGQEEIPFSKGKPFYGMTKRNNGMPKSSQSGYANPAFRSFSTTRAKFGGMSTLSPTKSNQPIKNLELRVLNFSPRRKWASVALSLCWVLKRA